MTRECVVGPQHEGYVVTMRNESDAHIKELGALDQAATDPQHVRVGEGANGWAA